MSKYSEFKAVAWHQEERRRAEQLRKDQEYATLLGAAALGELIWLDGRIRQAFDAKRRAESDIALLLAKRTKVEHKYEQGKKRFERLI